MTDSFFRNKRVLVTGACGTVGSELIRQLLDAGECDPAEVIGVDNKESEVFFLDQQYLNNSRARFFILDVREFTGMVDKFHGIDIIFHCAGLKHVVLCERSPEQAGPDQH